MRQYEEMMKQAKKKEEEKRKRERLRAEARDQHFSIALKEWETSILPNWKDMKRDRKTIELWKLGTLDD